MLLAVLFSHCSSPSSLVDGDGGGTKTGNPAVITATVVYVNGTPIPDCKVIVHRKNYTSNPDDLSEWKPDKYHMTTDRNGQFSATVVDTGEFYIEANDFKSRAVLFRYYVKNSDENVDLGTDTILPYSTINGKVSTLYSMTWVQICGMERIAKVDSQGEFKFSDIPQGTYSIRLLNSSSSNTSVQYNNIAVKTGESVSLLDSSWSHSKKIHLNTTPTGANIPSNMYNFPFFIRLDSLKYDFSQFQPDGKDVFFSKDDGTIISHQTEQWNFENKTASFWVKIDTLLGNSYKQFIIIHWGNTDSESVEISDCLIDSSDKLFKMSYMNESVNYHYLLSQINNYKSHDDCKLRYSADWMGFCITRKQYKYVYNFKNT